MDDLTARRARKADEARLTRSLRDTVDALASLATFDGACVVCGLTREEHSLVGAVAHGVEAKRRGLEVRK